MRSPRIDCQRRRMSPARWERLLGILIAGQMMCAALGSGCARADDTPGSSSAKKTLTICAIPESMPRMGKTEAGKPVGLDVALVTRLAGLLKRQIEFHWCASAQCAWICLPAGRCDVVIGLPLGSSQSRQVAWSVPYAAAQ